MKRPPQPDLFAPTCRAPRSTDEATIINQLRQAARGPRGTVNGMTPEAFRRCFPRRLPRVTVPQ